MVAWAWRKELEKLVTIETEHRDPCGEETALRLDHGGGYVSPPM